MNFHRQKSEKKYWRCGCPKERGLINLIHRKEQQHCALCGRNERTSRRAVKEEVYVFKFMLKIGYGR